MRFSTYKFAQIVITMIIKMISRYLERIKG
jgi:hypothetical protein